MCQITYHLLEITSSIELIFVKSIYKTIPRNLYALQWAQPKDVIKIK